MTVAHGFSAAEVDELLVAVGQFAQRVSLPSPVLQAMPVAVLRVESGTAPSAYAVQLMRDGPHAITLDRVEIRGDLRGKRDGSRLFYAVETWARAAGIRRIDAHAQGSGAPLAALVGFDFDDPEAYRQHLEDRRVHVPMFRYPFEIQAMRPPGVDGHALLKTTGFDATRVFNEDPVLEEQARADRAVLGW